MREVVIACQEDVYVAVAALADSLDPESDRAEIVRQARALSLRLPAALADAIPPQPHPQAITHKRYLNENPGQESREEFWQPEGKYYHRVGQPLHEYAHELTLHEFARHPSTHWHGTPYGDFGQNESDPAVHVGTWKAAHEALAATIAGQHSPGGVPEVTPGPTVFRGYKHPHGHMISERPEGKAWEPYEHSHGVQAGLHPAMIPVAITGKMHPEIKRDFVGEHSWQEKMRPTAHSLIKRVSSRGQTPTQGYFYHNQAEGVERGPDGRSVPSVSAVVPHRSWLKTHEDLVKDALAAGKHVPEHVLADYPHLKAGEAVNPLR